MCGSHDFDVFFKRCEQLDVHRHAFHTKLKLQQLRLHQLSDNYNRLREPALHS